MWNGYCLGVQLLVFICYATTYSTPIHSLDRVKKMIVDISRVIEGVQKGVNILS